jgi:hypothetical protein
MKFKVQALQKVEIFSIFLSMGIGPIQTFKYFSKYWRWIYKLPEEISPETFEV